MDVIEQQHWHFLTIFAAFLSKNCIRICVQTKMPNTLKTKIPTCKVMLPYDIRWIIHISCSSCKFNFSYRELRMTTSNAILIEYTFLFHFKVCKILSKNHASCFTRGLVTLHVLLGISKIVSRQFVQTSAFVIFN